MVEFKTSIFKMRLDSAPEWNVDFQIIPSTIIGIYSCSVHWNLVIYQIYYSSHETQNIHFLLLQYRCYWFLVMLSCTIILSRILSVNEVSLTLISGLLNRYKICVINAKIMCRSFCKNEKRLGAHPQRSMIPHCLILDSSCSFVGNSLKVRNMTFPISVTITFHLIVISNSDVYQMERYLWNNDQRRHQHILPHDPCNWDLL